MSSKELPHSREQLFCVSTQCIGLYDIVASALQSIPGMMPVVSTPMKKISLLSPILLLALLASLSGCTSAPAIAPTATLRPQLSPGTQPHEVDLTATSFVQDSIRIKAGESVSFVDLLDGGPHLLCIGTNGQCQFHADGPKELLENGGLSIDAGQVRQVTFDHKGTYHITCAIHRSMHLIVTVT